MKARSSASSSKSGSQQNQRWDHSGGPSTYPQSQSGGDWSGWQGQKGAGGKSGSWSEGKVHHDPAVLSVNRRPMSGPGIVSGNRDVGRPPPQEWSEWSQWGKDGRKNKPQDQGDPNPSDWSHWRGTGNTEPGDYDGQPQLSIWGNASTTRHNTAGNALEEQVPPPPPPLPPAPPKRTALSAKATAFVPNSMMAVPFCVTSTASDNNTSSATPLTAPPPGSWFSKQEQGDTQEQQTYTLDSPVSPQSAERPEAPACPPMPFNIGQTTLERDGTKTDESNKTRSGSGSFILRNIKSISPTQSDEGHLYRSDSPEDVYQPMVDAADGHPDPQVYQSEYQPYDVGTINAHPDPEVYQQQKSGEGIYQ